VQRLTGFTHPTNDPRGQTYNLRQSIIAVGAGGLRGRGVVNATQTGLDYLPEHSTDFAFASLAEERGFFGASILLLLYLLIVWRALKIVASARDLYSAIVAGGIAFMFMFQVFVNSAMTMGAAPITGIPLPFVSVGGSSLITNFLAIGILQAIAMRRVGRRRA
jgi:rod shape determining protein RodA